jgi:monoamine oxidase
LFGTTTDFLRQRLRAHRVINWGADPFARGAYAYATVGASAAQEILNQPIDDTLYFAGEALYAGPHIGTVEAALVSGKNAAQKIVGVA